jgi:glucosamine-6-phosphate deaminase
MDSKQIFCMVPDARKANAVKACFEGGVSAMAPASILQLHPNTKIYLDADSASLLSQSAIETFCG